MKERVDHEKDRSMRKDAPTVVPWQPGGNAPIRRSWLPLLALIPAVLIVGDVFLWMRHHSQQTVPVPPAVTATARSAQNNPTTPSTTSGKPGPFSCPADDPATVRNHGVPVLTEAVSYGGETPSARSAKIARRLNDCFMNDLIPPRSVANMRQGILSGRDTGVRYVFFGYLHGGEGHETADVIVTVDPATATHYHTNPVVLACWWRDVLRDWLLIDQGKAPAYTVKYDRILERFFHHLEGVNRKYTHPDDRFGKALASLIDTDYADYDRLRLLYSSVPHRYDPHPDNYQPILADDGGP